MPINSLILLLALRLIRFIVIPSHIFLVNIFEPMKTPRYQRHNIAHKTHYLINLQYLYHSICQTVSKNVIK